MNIIRFKETNQRAVSKSFAWDIFLFGAEEDSGDANLSGLTASNSFSSPDGLWFSQTTGICWIQTDDGAFTDETNCMMLAAIPGQVGDGSTATRPTPKALSYEGFWQTLATGDQHACAVRSDLTLWCWVRAAKQRQSLALGLP